MKRARNTMATYMRCAMDNMTIEQCANDLGIMPSAVRKAASKFGIPIVKKRLTVPHPAPRADGTPMPIKRLSCSPAAIARWLEANS